MLSTWDVVIAQPVALVLLLVISYDVHSQAPTVTLTPDVVVAGSPELIRVRLPVGAKADGESLEGALA